MADTFELPDALVIQNVTEWKERFVTQLATGRMPPLDAGLLKDVDTAGLQLLLAVATETEKQGSQLSWAATSAELRDFAKALGVDTHLSLASA